MVQSLTRFSVAVLLPVAMSCRGPGGAVSSVAVDQAIESTGAVYRHTASAVDFQTEEAEAAVELRLPTTASLDAANAGQLEGQQQQATQTAETDTADLRARGDTAGSAASLSTAGQRGDERRATAEAALARGRQRAGEEAAFHRGHDDRTAQTATSQAGRSTAVDATASVASRTGAASALARADAGRSSAWGEAAALEAHLARSGDVSRRDDGRTAADVDRAAERTRGHAAHLDARHDEASLLHGSRSGNMVASAFYAHMEDSETMPCLSVEKEPLQSSVYIGQEFCYRTSLTNRGPLALRQIRVRNLGPHNARFLGVGYRWYEYLLPFLRRVSLDPEGNLLVRGTLPPGYAVVFITRYRAEVDAAKLERLQDRIAP
ncbi:MAG: hypothetical protein JXR77_10010 [Lentisphaeria bacterium]|nr:hypothetical protein [Lentisphaeria bacterium]